MTWAHLSFRAAWVSVVCTLCCMPPSEPASVADPSPSAAAPATGPRASELDAGADKADAHAPASAESPRVSATPLRGQAGNSDCPEGMVPIPGGQLVLATARKMLNTRTGKTFRVGPRTVEIATFCLDRTEVSLEQLGACNADEDCNPPATWGSLSTWGSSRKLPALVRYDTAERYCESKGKRLPHSNEWRFAAGGRAGWIFPWGKSVRSEDVCWMRSESLGPCEVGTSSADESPEGVRDLAGNVVEWVLAEPAWEPGIPRFFRIWGAHYTSRESSNIYRAMQSQPKFSEGGGRRAGFRCALTPEKGKRGGSD